MVQPIGGRLENHNRDLAARQVLLVAEACIYSDQRIKTCFRQSQKFAVLLSGPTGFLNGAAFVTVSHEIFLQRFRSALVNRNPHLSCATRLKRASSRAATASSRLTLGYCSRNWSSVSPPSRYSMRTLKGTRVPRNTGSPPRMLGSLAMTFAMVCLN